MVDRRIEISGHKVRDQALVRCRDSSGGIPVPCPGAASPVVMGATEAIPSPAPAEEWRKAMTDRFLDRGRCGPRGSRLRCVLCPGVCPPYRRQRRSTRTSDICPDVGFHGVSTRIHVGPYQDASALMPGRVLDSFETGPLADAASTHRLPIHVHLFTVHAVAEHQGDEPRLRRKKWVGFSLRKSHARGVREEGERWLL